MCGSTKAKPFGALAEYDAVNLSGAVASQSKTLSTTGIPVTFGTTNVTGATKIITVSSAVPATNITGVSYSKTTGGTVIAKTTATYTGTYSKPSSITQGTATPNGAMSFALQKVTTGGTTLVNSVGANATVTGTVTVPSESVWGVSSDVTSLVTGLTANSSSGVIFTTVDNGVLTISAIKVASSNVKTYNVGADGTYDIANGNAAITVGASSYNVSVPASKWITEVANPTINWVDGGATVTVSASEGTEIGTLSLSSGDYETTSAALTSGTITVLNGTSTFYGKVSAYAGGDTVVSGITNGTLSVELTKNS